MAFQAQIDEIRQILGVQDQDLAVFNCDRATALRAPCLGVSTDSREVGPGQLFVARRGETSDGHAYLQGAFEHGAVCAVVDRRWLAEQKAGMPFEYGGVVVLLGVTDTTQALGDLARTWRRKLSIRTFCVTGSNGKTTTKEILHSLLTALVGPGTASRKSFNNHVGLPQTLLSARAGDSFVLLEAGMNHAGELDYLGSIAQPDIGMLINVGPAHIEFFGSLENIADAKFELLGRLSDEGLGVIRGDDPVVLAGLARLEKRLDRRIRAVKFGLTEDCDFYASQIEELGYEGTAFNLRAGDRTVRARIPHLGRHNVYNALAAAAAVISGFPDLSLEQVAAALGSAASAPMRLELLKAGSMELLNDAYNANPASMAAAINTTYSLAQGRPFGLVLGDMLELGEHSARFHREIGRKAAEARPAFVIAVGKNAALMAEEVQEAGLTAICVESAEQALNVLQAGGLPQVKLLLIKASRGMALERVVQGLSN